MSGIVALASFDGKPTDTALLKKMTALMAFRGPKAQSIWTGKSVGLGNTKLYDEEVGQETTHPFSIDGETWITADARIDAREKLVSELRKSYPGLCTTVADHSLILHAYRVWGTDCVEHLIGDFSFVIWDPRYNRLFAARDQFGVAQLYYAKTPNGVVISNTINCIRLHPEVSEKLNDRFVSDYLMFRLNPELNTTAYDDIAKLPPAHSIVFENGQLELKNYYTLETVVQQRRDAPQDLAIELGELIDHAVQDRVRSSNVSSELSGGLDSSTVTEAANRHVLTKFGNASHSVYTHTAASRMHCQELEISSHLVDQLSLQQHVNDMFDDEHEFGLNNPEFCTPEPWMTGQHSVLSKLYPHAAMHAGYLLTGQGGDPLFHPGKTHFERLLSQRDWSGLVIQGARFLAVHRQLPMGLQSVSRGWHKRPTTTAIQKLPSWINDSYAKEHELADRLHASSVSSTAPINHRRSMFTDPLWRRLFTWREPGMTGIPLKMRHPFFDVRLLEFANQVPMEILGFNKHLLRLAVSPRLPKAYTTRKKTGLAGHPLHASAKQNGPNAQYQKYACHERMSDYADISQLRKIIENPTRYVSRDYKNIIKPASLSVWLEQKDNLFNQKIDTTNVLHLPC